MVQRRAVGRSTAISLPSRGKNGALGRSTTILLARFWCAPPLYIETNKKVSDGIGVDVTLQNSLSDVIPDLNNVPDLVEDVGEAPASSASVALSGREQASGSTDGVAVADATRALERLHSVAIPREGGIVTHMYSPFHIISALQLNSALKPQTTLQSIFALTAPFLFGSEGVSVINDAALRNVSLPSNNIMKDARIRLDMISNLWERERFPLYYTWRYLNPDSSPQLGWQWLVC